jgi:hypothetical protein
VISDVLGAETLSSNKIQKYFGVPPYVYQEQFSNNSLFQGDILRVTGIFREYFAKFYPEVTNIENEEKYVMVLTQSCDLVKGHKRKLKVSHINVCLIRTLKNFVNSLLAEVRPLSIGDKNLLEREVNDRLKDKLSKLFNNSDQKVNFFLPKKLPFIEDMVALIPLSFSFRADHYDLLLENKVLMLAPEFRAKIGYIISELYGRVGTPDLSDSGWGDKEIRDYINELLHDLRLIQVPDKSFLEYIQRNVQGAAFDIDELIQDFKAKKIDQLLQPAKNELMKNLKTELIRLFDDKDKINNLMKMEKKELSKEIAKILNRSGF